MEANYREKKIETKIKNDTSRTRTDASEESRFLIYRLRPLGHSVIVISVSLQQLYETCTLLYKAES